MKKTKTQKKERKAKASPEPKTKPDLTPEPESSASPSSTPKERPTKPKLDPTPIWKEADLTCPLVVESWTRARPAIYLCTHPEVCKNSNNWVIRCAGCQYRPKHNLEKIPIQQKPEYEGRSEFSVLPDKDRVRAMVQEQRARERKSNRNNRGPSARGMVIEIICSGLKGKALEDAIKAKLKESNIEVKSIAKTIRSANRAIKKRGLVVKEVV